MLRCMPSVHLRLLGATTGPLLLISDNFRGVELFVVTLLTSSPTGC